MDFVQEARQRVPQSRCGRSFLRLFPPKSKATVQWKKRGTGSQEEIKAGGFRVSSIKTYCLEAIKKLIGNSSDYSELHES